jgi:DNA-binding CsgD family transcriptional regulator/tetratricopeptide (TPR) repeat protein
LLRPEFSAERGQPSVRRNLRGVIVGRPGISAAMVGRRYELERLLAMVPSDDDPRVALIAGEAGVGKTRLVREVRSRLPESVTVLSGQATQEAVGRPFELLLEAIEPHVASWDRLPDELETRGRAARALLAPVAPQLGGDDQREYFQQELLRAAVEVVRHVIGEKTAFLVFEDLHWGDTESVKVFGRLGTASGSRLLALGTYRSERLNRRHPMAELLEQLERDQSLLHLTLQRLTTAEVAELLAGAYRRPIPMRVVNELHQRTGGNPFFLEELVTAAGELPPEELPDVRLPWNLSEAVLRHLDALDPDQLSVLESAAVAGQRFSFDLLQSMTGRDETELIEILRRLVDTGLLAEEAPDVLAFRHALTHESVVGSLLGRQRRRLHEAAFEALQQSGSEDYALLALHSEGAERYDVMVEMSRRGASHYLRTGATQEALRLTERGLAEAGEDVELLELASTAAWRADRLDDAAAYASQWEAVTTGSPEARSRALRLRARIEFDAGRPLGQLQYLEAARQVVEPLGETEELAWVYSQLAEAHMLVEEMESAQEWADRSLDLAKRVGSDGAKVRALVNKGSAIIESDLAAGIALLEEAAVLAESVGDHLSHVRAINNALIGGVRIWPPERTAAAIDRMQEVAERAGLDHFVTMAVTNRGYAAELDGNLDLAVSIFSNLGWDEQVGEYESSRIHLATLLCDGNDPDGATSVLDKLGEPEEPSTRCCYVVTRAYVAALRRDPEGVSAQMERFANDRSVAPNPGDDDAYLIAMIALKAGISPAEVRKLLDSVPQETKQSFDHDPALEPALEGALLAATGSHEEALVAYQRALDLDGRRSAAATIAWFRVLMAQSLLALGRNTEAVPQAREAWRLLERWPGWLADETLALLRRLGVGPEVEGPKALTSREREVAALLTEGLSNAEVADRLYISVRTAAVHVSHILTKLGMSSRAEVAAWAVRSGIAPTTDRVAG